MNSKREVPWLVRCWVRMGGCQKCFGPEKNEMCVWKAGEEKPAVVKIGDDGALAEF